MYISSTKIATFENSLVLLKSVEIIFILLSGFISDNENFVPFPAILLGIVTFGSGKIFTFLDSNKLEL